MSYWEKYKYKKYNRVWLLYTGYKYTTQVTKMGYNSTEHLSILWYPHNHKMFANLININFNVPIYITSLIFVSDVLCIIGLVVLTSDGCGSPISLSKSLRSGQNVWFRATCCRFIADRSMTISIVFSYIIMKLSFQNLRGSKWQLCGCLHWMIFASI